MASMYTCFIFIALVFAFLRYRYYNEMMGTGFVAPLTNTSSITSNECEDLSPQFQNQTCVRVILLIIYINFEKYLVLCLTQGRGGIDQHKVLPTGAEPTAEVLLHAFIHPRAFSFLRLRVLHIQYVQEPRQAGNARLIFTLK